MDFYKNFPDSSINLDESFQDILVDLTKNNVTCLDLLSTPPVELSNKHQLNLNKLLRLVHLLKKEQIAWFEPMTKTLGDVSDEWFSTTDASLDDLLGGGIYTRQITEVFGEAAAGKSQFVMQLTKGVSEKFPNSKSVLISTEGFIETKRLIQINPNLDNIFTINCMDLETQEHIFNVQLPSLLQKQDVKLVVIDSISHHLRVEFGNDFKRLKQKLIEISLNLLNLSIEYNFALVVTNQISEKPAKKILDTDYKKLNMDYQIGWLNGWKKTDILRRQGYDESEADYNGNSKVSTMGLDWEQFVDVKVLLFKKYRINEGLESKIKIKKNNDKDHKGSTKELKNKEVSLDNNLEDYWISKRSFKVVYSNRSIKSFNTEFQINETGIRSVDT